MNLKAFQKMLAEADEALAERRLSDAIALTQAIAKDTTDDSLLTQLEAISNDYDALLRFSLTGQHDEERPCQLNNLFCRLIEQLQSGRYIWQREHQQTSYGRIIAQINDLTSADIIDQLHRTVTASEGTPAFYEAADAAFTLMCHLPLSPEDVSTYANALQAVCPFCRKLMASALLIGNLHCYEPAKLQLLLRLGRVAHETDDDALRARVLVGIGLIYICYHPYFTYDTALAEQLSTFLTNDDIRPELPALCHALTLSSLSDRVGKHLDDFLPALREAIEKQNPWAQESEKLEKGKAEVKIVKIDEAEGERWMRLLSKQAHEIDSLRRDGFDVNVGSMTHLKNFSFFNHTAHWFYPFSEQVPLIREMLFDEQGRRDNMTLGILRHNVFCESDCYSFLAMLQMTRHMRHHQELLDEETRESLNELFAEFDESTSMPLMIDYCQSCHRFISHYADELKPLTPFSLTDRVQLPLLPLFSPLLTEHEDIADSVDAFIRMGVSDQAVVLLDAIMERSGASASLLRQKGFALMQRQLFARAASAFQQAQLMDDDNSLLRLTAQCLEALGRWEEALGLLRTLEAVTDFDAAVAEETASCLIHLQRWDEASERLFQVEFEGHATDNTYRAIAWCALHQGRYDRAITYYSNLTTGRKKRWEDVLNMGHAHWLNGQPRQALATYQQFTRLFNRSKKKQAFRHWSEPLREDFHSLLHTHLALEDFSLMLDAIERIQPTE